MEAEALTTQDLTAENVTTHEVTKPALISHSEDQSTSATFTFAGVPAEASVLTVEGSEAAPEATGPAVASRALADDGAIKTFDEFGIAAPICAALSAAGITVPFPIQALTMPIALDGHDVIGQARTGTGKTFAFGMPMLQYMLSSERGRPAAPRGLVMVPTRELAIQVAEDLRSAAARTEINIVTLYGGRAYEPQIEALATVDLVVGTPGRLLDLARQRQLDLSGVRILVLDEADRMLDLGFLPDVEALIAMTPLTRQTMLFSATMPSQVVTLARRHLNRPTHIRAEQHDEPQHVPTTDQHVFRAHQLDKIEVLARVLQASGRGLTIVFCRTRRAVDQVTAELTRRGFAAAPVHGDLGQSQRERALRAFRSGKVDVLVATDVAARGLDVDDVTHVVNHECPEDEKAYLHRIGRTGRAGRTGVAVTFVDWQDLTRWKVINDTLKLGHPEPVETYSTSEHLFTALGIPEGVTGSLPGSGQTRAGLEAEDLEDIGETGRTRSRQQPADGGHGSKSRGGRSGAGDSGRPGKRQTAGHETRRSGDGPGDASAGPKRPRRRTRGGVQVAEPGAQPSDSAGADSSATSQHSAGQPGHGPQDAAGEVTKPKSRRRRRPNRAAAARTGENGADDRADSTRPASEAERRDIAAG
jgi:superfamily II DNA/RNA helicase